MGSPLRGHSIRLFLVFVLGFFYMGCGRTDKPVFGNGSGIDMDGDGYDDKTGKKLLDPLGSGRGDGNWGGSSGNGLAGKLGNGPLGDVTLLFLDGDDKDRGNRFLEIPFRFKFSGPLKIQTITCNGYTLDLVNILGSPTPYKAPITADIGDDGEGVNVGAFYSDSQCKSPIGDVTFNTGEWRKQIYYRSAMARTTVLMADSRLNGFPLIGRYRINIETNTQHRVALGINFEDYTDWDYNDSVVCLPDSTLVVDGTEIRSFANQTLRFTVQGKSACDSSIRLKSITEDGRTLSDVTLPSTRATPSVEIKFTYGSRLEVAFYAKGSCSFNRWITQNENRVRVANTCRSSSDEGIHW